MVNGTLLNFGKRYKDDLRVIFDQSPKMHLGLDSLSNQKILKGIYCAVPVLLLPFLACIGASDDGSCRQSSQIRIMFFAIGK